MKQIIKKSWILLACVLLFFPALIAGLLMRYIIDGVTGCGWLALFIGILIVGMGTSLPIINEVNKAEKMKTSVKFIIIIVSVLFFSGVAVMITKTPQDEIEEFHRKQQEWENQQIEQSAD